MKRDTRPTCASCGDRTEGFRCADCRPDRIYCRMCVRGNVPRIEANGKEDYVWLCLSCHHIHESCKLCRTLTTHHTPNGVCPRCMRVVYMEAEALAREFEAAANREDDFAMTAAARLVVMAEFRDWLIRQRAMAMPAEALAAENRVEVANG